MHSDLSRGNADLLTGESFIEATGKNTGFNVMAFRGSAICPLPATSGPRRAEGYRRLALRRRPPARGGLDRAPLKCSLSAILRALQGNAPKATFGRMNALAGLHDDAHFIQIDLPIQPGDSGAHSYRATATSSASSR